MTQSVKSAAHRVSVTRRKLRAHSDAAKTVMAKLAAAERGQQQIDPLVERLRQCPEAFTAGEMFGKLFDAIKYDRGDAEKEERLLPPAGVVMPLM